MRNSPDFERTSPELGQRVDTIPRRSSNLLRVAIRSASLAFASLILSGSLAQADEGIQFVDDGTFPQCTDIIMADNAILNQNPLDFPLPFTAFNPQLRHAMETMWMNGLDSIIAISLLPQGTGLRINDVTIEYRCLPDSVRSPSRFIVQTGEGSGVGLPTGGRSDRIIEAKLPEGRNLIVVNMWGERYPGSEKERMEWLLFAVDGEINLRNSDGSFSVTTRGPLALPSARGSYRWIEFVTPERGFADDIMLYPH